VISLDSHIDIRFFASLKRQRRLGTGLKLYLSGTSYRKRSCVENELKSSVKTVTFSQSQKSFLHLPGI
jgi:hypothetical protein